MTVLIRHFKKYLIFCIAALPAMLQAQGSISVESQVDRTTVNIGDVVQYSVIVSHGPDVNVIMPELAANLGMFELRDYQVQDPVKQDSLMVSRTDYLLSTFDTGEFEIPELQIGYTTETDSTVHFLKTEPLLVNVQSLDPEVDGDIRDIKPPLVPPFNAQNYIMMGLIALGLLAAAFAAWYFICRYRQGKALLPVLQKPPRPAHEVALEALNALVKGTLLADGEYKTYYSEMSDIVRCYIRDRFYIDAPEMTTYQLLGEMESQDLKQDYTAMMREFLNGCDLVKFAKYGPDEKENEVFTQLAFDFVEQTKMIIEEVPETEPDAPAEFAEDGPIGPATVNDGPASLPAAEESETGEERRDV